MYLLTARIIDFCFNEKLQNCVEKLGDEDLVELNKFFFMTYSRISDKKDVCGLKPGKLFTLHDLIIKKGGVGMLHRSLFRSLKNKKKNIE